MDPFKWGGSIASVAAALLEAAKENPDGAELYADLMNDIADAATNPEQATTIRVVSGVIAAGEADDVPDDVFEASPS